MAKKRIVVTGKEEVVDKDLSEIITGRKKGKFESYSTRGEYQDFLKSLQHLELCDELLRLSSYPSTDQKICIERCLAAYDRAHAPKKTFNIKKVAATNLNDLLK